MIDWRENGATRITAILAGTLFILVLAFSAAWFLPLGRITYSSDLEQTATSTAYVAPVVPTHITTPNPLKAVYITACTASMEHLRDKALQVFDGTKLNALIIDVKDYSGTISYASTSFQTRSQAKGCRISDLPEFLAELHARGIYTIARVTVFQDPLYSSLHPNLAVQSKSHPGSVWKDKHGLAFIDVGAKPYWDYIVGIAEEAYGIGFDEINFDYIRFPSDGNLADMNFTWDVGATKAQAVKGFFTYLHSQLGPLGIPTSADLFGLVTSATDDMGIGQVLENALPYFDFIAPMVYPSHFAPGYDGLAKPAEHPYQVINTSMSHAVKRTLAASSTPEKLRPWLQDFNLGAIYTPDMVHQQMQATYDSGLSSWMLWNAGSVYQKDALLLDKEQGTTTRSAQKR